MGDRVIDVRRLRKSYGGVERLHGISFSVERGEIFGFLGTNGAVAMFSRYFRQPTDLDATIMSAGLADKAGERVGRL